MKKTYIKPEIEIAAIELNNIIAASITELTIDTDGTQTVTETTDVWSRDDDNSLIDINW